MRLGAARALSLTGLGGSIRLRGASAPLADGPATTRPPVTEYSCFPDGVSADITGEGACDFPSVTFLKSGRVAVSFADAAHRKPAIAIQLPR